MASIQGVASRWTRFKRAARFAVGATVAMGFVARYYQNVVENRIHDNSMVYWKVKDIIVKEELQFDRDDVIKRLLTGKKLTNQMAFLDVLKTLEYMEIDKRITGIICDLSGPGQGFSMSQVEEIHTILSRIKAINQSFKLVAVTDSFDNQADYLFASKFDKIIMEPTGTISLPGFSTAKPFFKALLDKIGLEFIAMHAGAYKAFGTELTEMQMPEKQKHNLSELLSDLNNLFFQKIAKALTPKSLPPLTIAAGELFEIQNQTGEKIAGLIAELKTVNEKSAEDTVNQIAFLMKTMLITTIGNDPLKQFEVIKMVQSLPNNIRIKIMEKVNNDMNKFRAELGENTPEEVSKITLLQKVSDMSPIDYTEALEMKLISNIGYKFHFYPLGTPKEINGTPVMTFYKYFTNMKKRIHNPLPIVAHPVPLNVGIVYLTGTINRHSDKVVRALLQASRDPSIKAILLRVDSGGGDVTVSDQIAETVSHIRTNLKIPVIASYASVAASGGLYATANCDLIFGNKSTITGSIGVASIRPHLPKNKLLEYGIGIEEVEMSKAAKNSSLFNRMDEAGEERTREHIENVYDRFKYKVSKGRQLTMDEVEEIAQGQVFTGQRALSLKLLDGVGTFLDALRAARAVANFPLAVGKDVVFPKRKTLWDAFFSSSDSDETDSMNVGKILADIVAEKLEEKQQLSLEIDRSFNIKDI